MNKLVCAGILIFILSTSLTACGPASLASDSFAGTWTTNLGMMNFVQNGNELIGSMEGYGGTWNETFTGTINENGEAVFNTEILGSFTLVRDKNTFKSTSSDLSFCGILGANMELPAGCGFSGKWVVPSKSVFLKGSIMVLKQVGENVSGEIFDGNGNSYEGFNGKMDWGKGWRANGEFSERGEISLWMNAAETGFEFVSEKGNIQQLCAVREGVDSAYLGSYYCEP
jgi:hypothetical protein